MKQSYSLTPDDLTTFLPCPLCHIFCRTICAPLIHCPFFYTYAPPFLFRPPFFQVVLNFKRWRIEEYEAVLPSLTPEDLTTFLRRLMGRMFLEALLVGNMDGAEATAIAQAALEKLGAAWGAKAVLPGEEKDIRVIKLPAGRGNKGKING